MSIPDTSVSAGEPDSRLGRQRLPLPKAIRQTSILWAYALPIAIMHLLALLALVPWLFSWTAFGVMVVGVLAFGQGINLCYHRLLAHRSFKTPKWVERCFVMVSLCCLEDTPAKWVATHRYHHVHPDEREDPHTPLVNFLWAHIGWLIINNPGMRNWGMYQKYARDILEDPFYLRLEKTMLGPLVYLAHALLFFVAGGILGWCIGGSGLAALQMALGMLVWGVIVRTVVVWHITWSVNSLTHLFGYRNYETGENSRNNWLVGLISSGEGWHNNHHYDPAAATVQHRWWEIDATYYMIKVLQWLGLATDIIPPKHSRHAARHGGPSMTHANDLDEQ